MNDYSAAVCQQAAELPQCWKTDHRIKVAKHLVDSNAQYELTNNINEFAMDAALPQQPFRSQPSEDQMPTTSNMSAALPANLTQQGGTAADQITPEHIADFVGTAYHKFSPAEQGQLCQLLGDIIDAQWQRRTPGPGVCPPGGRLGCQRQRTAQPAPVDERHV